MISKNFTQKFDSVAKKYSQSHHSSEFPISKDEHTEIQQLLLDKISQNQFQINQLTTEINQHDGMINNILNSKFYKIWQKFCSIKKVIWKQA